MSFLGFLRHVIALLRSSYVPQAFFSGKNGVPEFLRHVIALLRSFYVPQALFLPANSDSQMALAIVVMGEELWKPIL